MSFTSDGDVLLLLPENLVGDAFEPDLVLRGGTAELTEAVLDPTGFPEGIVEQLAPTPQWEPVLRLVRQELSAVLDGPASDQQQGR